MEVVIKSVESILSIIIMVVLGYFLTAKGWFDEKSKELIVKLVMTVSMPALMVNNFTSNFDRYKILSIGDVVVVPIISIFLSYLVSIVICRIIKVKNGRQGAFKTMFFNSNTLFMGLPINVALFGDKSILFSLVYYIINTIYFWTIGVYEIEGDGNSNGKRNIFSKDILSKILSPPLMGFLVALAFILLSLPLPKFVLDTCRYLGNLTTPLSMIFIGIIIHSTDIGKIRFEKDTVALIIGRFVIAPMIAIIVTLFLSTPELARNVFVIMASMPVMTNSAIITKAYDGDYEYTAIMIILTTVGMIFVVPLYMLILKLI